MTKKLYLCAQNLFAMRKCFLFGLLFFVLFSAVAQNDSLTLVNAHWQIDTMGGLVLKRVQFSNHDYFQSNQHICVLEIPADGRFKLRYAYEPRRTRTSVMATQHQALAAVNGSFFDMEQHDPICYLRVDGQEVGINKPGKDTVNRKYYQYGTLVLDDVQTTGSLARIVLTDSNRFWERSLLDEDIMTAGPLLIYQGKSLPMRNDLSFVRNRHNRTAVGIRPDHTVLLLTVDGRTQMSAGFSLDELIQTMRWLGCTEALNMDGGGSTTMVVRGTQWNGVVNYPSDNYRFDHHGERAVSNAILVVPAE